MQTNSLKDKNIFQNGRSFSDYVEKYSGGSVMPVSVEKILVKFSFSLVFVILMWISANSFMYLPFTPVPVTMQVFTVLFCAISLGKTWALVSQLEYLVLGLAGFPLFAGFKNGLAVLLGPTGGYVIGFSAAAFVTGFVYKKFSGKIGGSGFDVFISCVCGLSVIYTCGCIHLAGILYLSSKLPGSAAILLTAFKAGVLPFIIFDLLKIVAIATIQKSSERKKQAI
ncbi:MAG TPA: biotin transporter BioY [Candidatus Humimicrobiaceae bacterium]